jgi:uncharacterized protein with HEPN domain
MPTDRPAQRPRDIQANVARIRAYTFDMTLAAFEADRRTVDAVERCLERIAEAARKLGEQYDDRYPHLDLPQLRQLGSKLRHDYDELSPRRIWAFLRRLDDLEAFAKAEIAKLEAPE